MSPGRQLMLWIGLWLVVLFGSTMIVTPRAYVASVVEDVDAMVQMAGRDEAARVVRRANGWYQRLFRKYRGAASAFDDVFVEAAGRTNPTLAAVNAAGGMSKGLWINIYRMMLRASWGATWWSVLIGPVIAIMVDARVRRKIRMPTVDIDPLRWGTAVRVSIGLWGITLATTSLPIYLPLWLMPFMVVLFALAIGMAYAEYHGMAR